MLKHLEIFHSFWLGVMGRGNLGGIDRRGIIGPPLGLIMYSGGYPFSVPVIPVHFFVGKTDYLLRS